MSIFAQVVEANSKALEVNCKAVTEMVNLLKVKGTQKPKPIVDERMSAAMKTEKLEVDMRSKLL